MNSRRTLGWSFALERLEPRVLMSVVEPIGDLFQPVPGDATLAIANLPPSISSDSSPFAHLIFENGLPSQVVAGSSGHATVGIDIRRPGPGEPIPMYMLWAPVNLRLFLSASGTLDGSAVRVGGLSTHIGIGYCGADVDVRFHVPDSLAGGQYFLIVQDLNAPSGSSSLGVSDTQITVVPSQGMSVRNTEVPPPATGAVDAAPSPLGQLQAPSVPPIGFASLTQIADLKLTPPATQDWESSYRMEYSQMPLADDTSAEGLPQGSGDPFSPLFDQQAMPSPLGNDSGDLVAPAGDAASGIAPVNDSLNDPSLTPAEG